MALASYDLETWAVDLSVYPTPPIVCCSFQVDGEAAQLVQGAHNAVLAFCRLLREGHHVGGANFVFDLGCLCAAEPAVLPKVFKALDEGRLHSTDVLEALHDVARGCLYKDPQTGAPIGRYSLALLEKRYFGRDRSAEKGPDAWRMRYHELEEVPLDRWPAEARDYPLADATGTLELLKLQLGPGRFNVELEAARMRVAWALKLMSLRGIRTDPQTTAEVVAEIERQHIESRETFLGAGLVKMRRAAKGEVPDVPGVPCAMPDHEDCVESRGTCYQTDKKAIAARVAAAYAGNPPLTEKGSISTSRDTLEESGDDLLEAFGEAGVNEKLYAVYCDVLKQGTKRPIHVEFNSFVASGRTSCSKPNLQQLPRAGRIRECFSPRPGHLLLSTDYGTLEMGTLAQICFSLFGYSVMREALNAGQDLHTRLAARFAGIEYEEALARLKAKDKTIKDLRQAAKPVNFGLPGLMGGPKLVLTARKQGVRFCELSGALEKCGAEGKVNEYAGRQISPTCRVCLDLAGGYKRLFFAEWPEVADYHALTTADADSGEPQESLSEGKMLRLEPSAAASANHLFQNLAAVLATDAAYQVTKAYLTPGHLLFGKGAAILFLHDEVLSEVREEVAHECAMEQSKILVDVARRHCPDVTIAAPPALCRRWFKNMEPVWEAGRLVPWAPTPA